MVDLNTFLNDVTSPLNHDGNDDVLRCTNLLSMIVDLKLCTAFIVSLGSKIFNVYINVCVLKGTNTLRAILFHVTVKRICTHTHIIPYAENQKENIFTVPPLRSNCKSTEFLFDGIPFCYYCLRLRLLIYRFEPVNYELSHTQCLMHIFTHKPFVFKNTE